MAKWTPYIAQCPHELLIYDIDGTPGNTAGAIHDGSVVTISVLPNYTNGQFFFDIQTVVTNNALDPGGTLTIPSWQFRISVASPDHANASNTALNPQTYDLVIYTGSPCRN